MAKKKEHEHKKEHKKEMHHEKKHVKKKDGKGMTALKAKMGKC